MSHGIKVHINYNKQRSFCYYNKDGSRIKIYNGKLYNEDLYPNKEKDIVKRKILLSKLKNLVENNLNSSNHSSSITRNNRNKNSYEQSVFKERIPIKLYEHSKVGSKAVALEI